MRDTSNDRSRSNRLGRLVLTAALAVPVACIGGDSLTNPPTNNGKGTIPWAVNLNHHAINIVVGDQLQLTVSPEDADGAPMAPSSLPPVAYTVSDTTAVSVDANGNLTALRPASSVLVIAEIKNKEEGWTVADSTRVAVVDAPYAFSGFKLWLEGETLQPSNQSRRFGAVVTDASGVPLVNADGDTIRPMTHYAVSEPRSKYYVSNNWSGIGYARNLAEPTITGTAYIYGTVYTDSVKLTVTYPDSAILYVHRLSTTLNPSPSAMSQTDLTILKGGKVTFWQNNTTSPGDDIVFDDPTAVINGSIATVARDSTSTVTFPNVGSFTYTSTTISDVRGTITVVERPTQ